MGTPSLGLAPERFVPSTKPGQLQVPPSVRVREELHRLLSGGVETETNVVSAFVELAMPPGPTTPGGLLWLNTAGERRW
jgi:hypothetical protein